MLQYDAGLEPAHHSPESENSSDTNSLEQVNGYSDGRATTAPAGAVTVVETTGVETTREFWLPARPDSACRARRLTTATTVGWFSAEMVDLALLLVSELVTNSIRYASGKTGIRLEISRQGGALRVSVWDDNPSPPTPRHADELDVSGRGLTLVAEISSDWGWEPAGAGKRVWFELHET